MSIYKAENQSSQNMKIDDMPFLAKILENIREVIAYDKQQKQPLILRINEAFIFKIARKAILEKNSTFLMSIAGESASGKTTLVKNTAKACIKTDTDNAYTVICCDDYYKDASKELTAAGSYEELFKTGFSFDTPDAIDLNLMKEHLIKLKNGETVYSPYYDFVTCESKLDSVIKKPAKIILNEGLYVLNEFTFIHHLKLSKKDGTLAPLLVAKLEKLPICSSMM